MAGALRQNDSPPIVEYTTLTDTAETAVVDSTRAKILNELQISNDTGSSVNCVVKVYNVTGSASVYTLQPTKSVASKAIYKLDIDALPLREGYTIRVTGAADVQVMAIWYTGADDRSRNSPAARG